MNIHNCEICSELENCICEFVKLNPGDNSYSCEFCGIYTASKSNCNKCEEWVVDKQEIKVNPQKEIATAFYPFRQMKVKDSFHIPIKHKANREREYEILLARSKEHGKKRFYVEIVDETDEKGPGVRCWRKS